MSPILLEIEEKVEKLSPFELNDFRKWFLEFENKKDYKKNLNELELNWENLPINLRDELILKLLKNSVIENGDIISPIDVIWEAQL